jgi:hypothetical protein
MTHSQKASLIPPAPAGATAVRPSPITQQTLPRVRVFVDYWNFQLTLNQVEAEARGLANLRVRIAWGDLGLALARQACATMGITGNAFSFDGAIIYASYNPKTTEGKGFRKWATTWLDRQAGINVVCLERKPRALPKCPTCHRPIQHCPHADCGAKIVATVEKGVDTFIATDMIRLAWESAFDVAVLASSDGDLVPAVEFLNQKGGRSYRQASRLAEWILRPPAGHPSTSA